MGKTFIGVREIDEEVYNKFRSLSVEQRLKLGDALTLAMKLYIEKEKQKIKNKSKKKFLQVKPFSWGPGTERASEEIDKILYE
ncbi:MAG: hypothetical protein ABIH37_00095 [archaeon]